MIDQDAYNLYLSSKQKYLKFETLSSHLFPTGMQLFVVKLSLKHLTRPYVAHFNRIRYQTKKKKVMKGFNCWFLEDSVTMDLKKLHARISSETVQIH